MTSATLTSLQLGLMGDWNLKFAGLQPLRDALAVVDIVFDFHVAALFQ